MKEGLEVDARPLLLTIGASRLKSVLMNTYPSLHPKPDFDAFYCAYIKGDAAKHQMLPQTELRQFFPGRAGIVLGAN